MALCLKLPFAPSVVGTAELCKRCLRVCVWCAAHLEATQPKPPGATTTEGGAWAYDDTSLIHLLRVIR